MFIDGSWVEAQSGYTFEVTNPATGEVLGAVPAGDAVDATAAIDAANAAFPAWSRTTAYERSRLLYRAWELMTERSEDLAQLMTSEQGKPLKASRAEVKYAADFLIWFAEEAKRVTGEWLPSQRADQRFLSVKAPVGVVGVERITSFVRSVTAASTAPRSNACSLSGTVTGFASAMALNTG